MYVFARSGTVAPFNPMPTYSQAAAIALGHKIGNGLSPAFPTKNVLLNHTDPYFRGFDQSSRPLAGLSASERGVRRGPGGAPYWAAASAIESSG